MGFAKTASQPVRKIQKMGDMTYSITLPKDLVRKLKWREGQNVVVSEQSGKLIIEDWQR